METLSPELALIDPDLLARARRSLPDPPDCLTRPVGRRNGATSDPSAFTLQKSVERRPNVRRLSLVVSCLVIAAFVGSSLLAFLPPETSARPVLLASAPASLDRRGAVGDPEGSSVTLHWPTKPEADAYGLIVMTGGGRLDRLVTGTSARLTVLESDSGRVTRWYVYPARVEAGSYRYGKLWAQGSLAAGRASIA